jgi:hypothetical protein
MITRNEEDMKLQRVALVLAGMMFLLTDKSSAQHVKSDYDHRANFAEFKTYSWDCVKTQDSSSVDRIKAALERVLTRKGWARVDSGGRVSIVAIEITQDQETLDTFYDSLETPWGWRRVGARGFRGTAKTTKYPTGTLVVDLFDVNTKQLLWRSSSSGAFSSRSQDNGSTLDRDIDKMFRWFPPTPSPFEAADRDDRPN